MKGARVLKQVRNGTCDSVTANILLSSLLGIVHLTTLKKAIHADNADSSLVLVDATMYNIV